MKEKKNNYSKDKNLIVAVRISEELQEKINDKIKEFPEMNLSVVVRLALADYLEKREENKTEDEKMSFYKTQMIVFEKIDNMIMTTLKSGNSLNVNQVVLDITRNYPVSPKSVRSRIELFVSTHSDTIEIFDGEVRLK